MHRISFSISQFFKKLLERESTHISGIGGLTLLFGCYLPIVTGSDQEIVMVIIITLSVGDGFATITGRYLGIYALSISKSRSILGTLGGLVAALIVSMVLIEDFDLWLGSAVALGIAIELCVGLLPNRISAFVARFSLDNLLIPIGMMIFCSL
jgi:dolichol kinase